MTSGEGVHGEEYPGRVPTSVDGPRVKGSHPIRVRGPLVRPGPVSLRDSPTVPVSPGHTLGPTRDPDPAVRSPQGSPPKDPSLRGDTEHTSLSSLGRPHYPYSTGDPGGDFGGR